MSDIAIKVQNLGKMYRIGAQEKRPDNVWEAAKGTLLSPLDYLRRITRPPTEEETLWALKDVTFEVARGEVLGIIGRNGAGKTTLLKILSRITEPTKGQAMLHGRVGSLLEVGTGFHPELTGRENIYLNGAILGMTRAEIDRKFDEIVAFSGVERFIDTPVKRYSSGMYVRLAFSVAAHLEPEILLVDEVLAVGDASFRNKSLGKMGKVAREGRTVLFVSHNLAAVSRLCAQALLLDHGSVVTIDEASSAIQQYVGRFSSDSLISDLTGMKRRDGSGPIRFTSFHCETAGGKVVDHLVAGKKTRLILGYEAAQGVEPRNVAVSVIVYTAGGVRLTNLLNEQQCGSPFELVPTCGQFVCELPRLQFRAGRYTVDLWCRVDHQVSDWIQDAAVFDVTDGDFYRSGRISTYHTGCLFIDHSWELRRVAGPSAAGSRCRDATP